MHGFEFRNSYITSNPRLERLRKYYADRSQAFSLELWDRSDTRFRIKSDMKCDDSADASDASKCDDFPDAPDASKCDDFADAPDSSKCIDSTDAPVASKCIDFTKAPDALVNIMHNIPDDSDDPLDDFAESQRFTKSVAEVIARYSSIDGMSTDFILTILYIILLITTFSIQFDF
jgi:hypothetical protein